MTTPSTPAPTFIYACSGGSDVGHISDLAARSLTRRGAGKMFCLAGIGGRVPDIMDRAKTAGRILAIDGCEKDCAKACLAAAGFVAVQHVRVTNYGLEKGKSPATPEVVEKITDLAASLLG